MIHWSHAGFKYEGKEVLHNRSYLLYSHISAVFSFKHTYNIIYHVGK